MADDDKNFSGSLVLVENLMLLRENALGFSALFWSTFISASWFASNKNSWTWIVFRNLYLFVYRSCM